MNRLQTLLFDSGEEQLALKYLTERSHEAAADALALGNALLASIEARTRVLYGLRAPETDEISKLDYNAGALRLAVRRLDVRVEVQ